jgi:hypothetical protein
VQEVDNILNFVEDMIGLVHIHFPFVVVLFTYGSVEARSII